MNKRKLQTFVKSHKKGLMLGIGIAGGVMGLVIAKKVGQSKDLAFNVTVKKMRDIAVPKEFSVGKITELWKENGYLNAIADNIAVSDIGRFGEEFIKNGLVTNDAEVSLIIGFLEKK